MDISGQFLAGGQHEVRILFRMEPEAAWYEQLGRMVSAAAELEGNLAYLAVRMTALGTGRMLDQWTEPWQRQAAKPVSASLKEIRKLSAKLRDEDTKRFLDACSRAELLIAERNRHVHSITFTGIVSVPYGPVPIGRQHPKTGERSDLPAKDELAELTRAIKTESLVASQLSGTVDASVMGS